LSPEEPKPHRTRLTSSNWSASDPVLRFGGRTVFTRGRPPWYTCDGQQQECFVIGICGGSGSGKTTVAQKIIERLNVSWVSLLSMDCYYKVLTPEELEQVKNHTYNFDHPNAIDHELLINHLSRLREGKSIQVPEYDFKTHSRTSKTRTLYGANVVIFEGVLSFFWPDLTKVRSPYSPLLYLASQARSETRLMDLKVFVDTDSDERLSRRLLRDTSLRGRNVPDVLLQYNSSVKPAYDQYIAPTMSIADIIVPRGGENNVAIDIIARHVEKRLKEHSHRLRSAQANGLRNNLSHLHLSDTNPPDLTSLHNDCLIQPWGDTNGVTANGGVGQQFQINETDVLKCLPPNVRVLPLTPQARCLHTLLRDRNTNQDAFVFYAERLMRPLCEFACRLLPYEDVVVDTPQGIPYHGRRLAPNTQICGVSILRAGEAFEPSLSVVCKDVQLGKILIQTNPETMEPELHYLRLPSDIKVGPVILCTYVYMAIAVFVNVYRCLRSTLKDSYVILMDSTVASGAAAIMAMRILLEHDVPEDHIILISLIVAVQGAHSVAYAYPSAHIVTSAIDPGLTENYHILPGIGNFGDRYFGTSPLK
uniref:uridine/cytidine kinase n=1 Tax=Schistocephalus solidus TaxID=70667 RepID=A0A183SUV1_SCHSO